MTHPNVHLDVVDHVATVTIDRPRRKNACTAAMWDALADAFTEIGRSNVRAAVVTGAGGEFCAGADVVGDDSDVHESGAGDSANSQATDLEAARRRGIDSMRDIARTVMAIHDCPKPVVAKVDGVAVGAGFGIALAADVTWCSDRARFSLIFAKRGLSLDFGTSWLLPKRIGLHEAKRLALTGEIIGAARAAELGIVNDVVPVDALDDAVDGIVAQIVGGPPIALSITKRYLNSASTISLFEALEAEGLGQSVNFGTADMKEAFAAFAEKRDPVFEGR